jgi:NAD(P) transhydrogenase subunit alpha
MDLAAERGGNCELTAPGETVVHGGVTILGPANLPAEIPFHASQMYGKNITTFLLHLVKDGRIHFDLEDEIVRDTLVTRDGRVVQLHVCQALGIEPPLAATEGKEAPADDSAGPQEDIYDVKKDA